MQDKLLFVISPPRAGSTMLQSMLGSHAEVFTHPEPHLISPLAHLGYYANVDKAPYDHINAAEAMKAFVSRLPGGESDYLDALRACTDTLYGRMLEASGSRYFLDKTPANALVLPFLARLYPDARFVVLTRHPLAVMSSYANSFFSGSWKSAQQFNPILQRYVPAMAHFLRNHRGSVLLVKYEQLVAAPDEQLQRIFDFLELTHDPEAVDYGQKYEAREGMGDPINVRRHGRPVTESIEKWVGELKQDQEKRELAVQISASLADEDLSTWGYSRESLLSPLEDQLPAGSMPQVPIFNRHVLKRRILLYLKPLAGRGFFRSVLTKVRYFCDVLLRD